MTLEAFSMISIDCRSRLLKRVGKSWVGISGPKTPPRLGNRVETVKTLIRLHKKLCTLGRKLHDHVL